MTESSTDRIHKEITLRAPLSRVWQALTDSGEFGEWFGVRLEGPFRVGEKIQGRITHPGHEHLTFQAWVERMEPERSFAFRWHPKPSIPRSITRTNRQPSWSFTSRETAAAPC